MVAGSMYHKYMSTDKWIKGCGFNVSQIHEYRPVNQMLWVQFITNTWVLVSGSKGCGSKFFGFNVSQIHEYWPVDQKVAG